jgi:hypothetical protein
MANILQCMVVCKMEKIIEKVGIIGKYLPEIKKDKK